ncbi:MAG TPA: hypothetical protein VN639_03290 [Azonexus sp.]|nr:hypothetical protein [Azonexus sp.]
MIVPSPAQLLRGLALAALVVAWAWVAHQGSAGAGNPDFSVAVATAPVAVLLVILLWRIGKPLGSALGGLAMLGLLAWFWPALRQNVALLYYLQHLGTNLALAALFGHTLFGSHEALVTQFARMAHGGVVSAAQERYSRQVTIAWSIFFLANGAVSSILFWLATPAAWSLFANVLGTPLVAAMFVLEHLCRNHFLPPEDRSSVADTIRGYREAMAARRQNTQARHP